MALRYRRILYVSHVTEALVSDVQAHNRCLPHAPTHLEPSVDTLKGLGSGAGYLLFSGVMFAVGAPISGFISAAAGTSSIICGLRKMESVPETSSSVNSWRERYGVSPSEHIRVFDLAELEKIVDKLPLLDESKLYETLLNKMRGKEDL